MNTDISLSFQGLVLRSDLNAMRRMLVAEGAWQWALKRALLAAKTREELEMWNVTDAAQKQWQRYKEMISLEQPAWQTPGEHDAKLPLPSPKRQKWTASNHNFPSLSTLQLFLHVFVANIDCKLSTNGIWGISATYLIWKVL